MNQDMGHNRVVELIENEMVSNEFNVLLLPYWLDQVRHRRSEIELTTCTILAAS